MNTWFTVKVRYTKQLENGTLKRVTEPYLLAAVSFTDAEARIYEELGALIRGEFMVVGIARTDLADIFQYEDSAKWFKCKITYGIEEEDGDKKKNVAQNFLVSASDVKEAYGRMEDSLAGLMIDYQVLSIVSSGIVDIFPYREEDAQAPVNVAQKSDEPSSDQRGVVYSAPGTDVEGSQDNEADESVEDNTLEDHFEDDNE
ncbi:MAG: DUF4494 domain-containing protein [Bacteroidetes bacterium]|nr:DUF4494 domain-containing protein [Bacteroidota bacterium]MBM3425323.1 DUF4494 domain-containing protein [Bacteroidota bacterium]